MYVILEYLVYLGLVSVFGLILFAAAVIGLVAKTGASRLAAEAANKLPKIASPLSPRQLRDFGKSNQNPLTQG